MYPVVSLLFLVYVSNFDLKNKVKTESTLSYIGPLLFMTNEVSNNEYKSEIYINGL